ncbi:MAG: MBL fold metallo-hydrolase [Spirochaetota bacterium]|nr:MBL fold metallo-hydrolase [Spirochaetota bacterium]
MQIITHENGPFLVNTYLVLNETSGKAFIIDPGTDIEPLCKKIEKEKILLEATVCTHGHLDHVFGVSALQKKYNIPFYMNKMDLHFIDSLPFQAGIFGVSDPGIPTLDFDLPTSGMISLADIQINLLYTPGHSKGSVSIYIEESVFSGDALFNFSIGRTDLPDGNYNELITSVKEKLFSLPEETKVFPGHGPSTTIGREREYNPFFD